MLLLLYCSFFKAFPVNILGLHGWLLRTSLGDDVQRKIWLLSFCVIIWLAFYHGFLCYLSTDASGQVDKEIRLKISGKWYRKYLLVTYQVQKRTWRRKAVPSEILVKIYIYIYSPDCKISLALFVLYFRGTRYYRNSTVIRLNILPPLFFLDLSLN